MSASIPTSNRAKPYLPLLIIGVVALAAAAFVRLALYPQYAQRIPPGWSWRVDFIGTNSYPDPETGELTIDTVSNYIRTVETVSGDAPAGSILLRDTYEVYSVDTGDVTWIYPFTAPVDPQTGAHSSAEYAGDVFVFPRNTQKQTYSFRAGSYEGLDVDYEREEVLEGVTTYVFSYQGYAEYSASYVNATAGGEFFELGEGQEVRCGDDTLDLRMWVEPITGEIVKFEESCADGDWIYDSATGEKLEPLGTWAGSTTGDSVIRRLTEVANQRSAIQLTSIILPVALVIVGVVGVILGLLPMLRRPTAPPPKAG
jgi:hypothetical protein